MKAKKIVAIVVLLLIIILFWGVVKFSLVHSGVFVFIVVWSLMGLALLIPWEHNIRKNIQNSENLYQKVVFANSTDPATIYILCFVIPYLFLPYILFIYHPRRRNLRKSVVCDNCQSDNTMKLKRGAFILQQAVEGRDGIKCHTFTCDKCGHRHFENVAYKYVEPRSSDSSSSSSSSSGSSSSRGGSWGGGRSGGGGASTKF